MNHVVPLSELEASFEAMAAIDPRQAAELAYAVEVLKRREADYDGAGRYARRAIELFESVSTNTIKDCAARFDLGGEQGGSCVGSC